MRRRTTILNRSAKPAKVRRTFHCHGKPEMEVCDVYEELERRLKAATELRLGPSYRAALTVDGAPAWVREVSDIVEGRR